MRDFTFLEDIVEGVIRVIDNPPLPSGKDSQNELLPDSSKETSTTAPFKVYNIGNSSPVQLMDYIAAIESHLGKTAVKEFLPLQPGDVPRTEADVTDLVRNLGYKPDTPVYKGVGEFIKWYKSFYINP